MPGNACQRPSSAGGGMACMSAMEFSRKWAAIGRTGNFENAPWF
jgi:hypothetical protein